VCDLFGGELVGSSYAIMNFTGASRRTGFIAGVLLVFPVASNVAIQPELLSVLATLEFPWGK
jgi:hypothetical protein